MESQIKRILDVVLDSTSQNSFNYFEQCRQILKKLQRQLDIGKVEIKLSNLNNLNNPHIKSMSVILFQDETYNEQDIWVKSMQTKTGEVAEYIFYPRSRHIFLKYQMEDISYLVKLLFIFFDQDRKETTYQEYLKRDCLTGIYNQEGIFEFMMRLEKERKIQNYDAFFINIKRFKYVNEKLGFEYGNQVMKEYAHKLSDFLMDYEAVGRMGGDNFVALVTRSNSNNFRDYCCKTNIVVKSKSISKSVHLEAVCGIYQINESIHNPGDVMSPLSIALKAAKELFHQDFVYYSENLNQQIMQIQRIRSDYETSLKQGEFIAYFQPKYSLKENQLCGAEALVRWVHEGTIISPCNFIPILEKDGSVCAIDFEMLKQSCQMIAEWKRRNLKPVRISVNLSRWHLHNKDLVRNILRILDDYDVSPEYIEFELTETVDYEEYAVLCKLFMELKANGFATAIDDFGTGYSSLNLLKNLDVDVLKLDKTFISEINSRDEKKDRILIKNMIHLAKDLNMQVIAEGIENQEQQQFLREAECDMAQGFLYAKPMTPDEFLNLILNQNNQNNESK